MRRSVEFAALVAGALMVAACANTTGDAGGATSATATATTPPPPTIVSREHLDVGTYSTTPRPPLGAAGNSSTGAVADAQAMSDFVIGPWDVDQSLITPYLSSYFVLNAPNALQQLGPESLSDAAGRHGFVDGFASARQATDKGAMINAVLRFADPAAATAAANDLNDAAAKLPIQGTIPSAAAIPGHPDAIASTYPFTPHGTNRTLATIRSFAAYGPYVLMQFVQSVDGFDPAAAMVAKALDLQGAAIDAFNAAPPDALSAILLDPTGLLARTIPATDASTAKNAVYGSRGAMHFQGNPLASATLFKDNGVTEVAMAKTNVYQAKDEPAAVAVTKSFGQEISDEGTKVADPVPGLPDSRCQAFAKGFYCVAPAGRYAIEARGDQLLDAQQLVAAQYVMLTAN